MRSAVVLPLIFETVVAGTVGIDIYRGARVSDNDAVVPKNFRRAARNDGTVSENLRNGFYDYYANLTIGSNDQPVHPKIDTGSSDFWIYSSFNPYCAPNSDEAGGNSDQINCSGYEFDPSASTSYKNLSVPFDISYFDGTVSNGWMAQDTIKIAGATLPDSTFALADFANVSKAVLGIGYSSNEATDKFFRNGTIRGEYSNLPMMLKESGYIDSIAYSLYLNDAHAQTGQILFGGVDHAKYYGTLGLMPIQDIYYSTQIVKVISAFNVKFSGLSVRTGDGICPLADFVIPVLLDSGASYAVLPSDIVDAMGQVMGFKWQLMNNENYWQGPCSAQFDFDSFELDFLGKKLEVPPQSLMDYLGDSNGNSVFDSKGEQICVLAVDKAGPSDNLSLGDVFLRNWYVVYDIDNNQIAMAQSNLKQSEPDVEPIESTIPRATSVSNYDFSGYQSAVTTYSLESSCTAKPTS